MRQVSEKQNAIPNAKSDNLPEQLRQISGALWTAAQHGNLNEVNSLLDRRQVILESLVSEKPMGNQLRRDLMAVQSADKYLMRQLNNELEWLDRRLDGVNQRRTAMAGYRTSKAKKTHITRIG